VLLITGERLRTRHERSSGTYRPWSERGKAVTTTGHGYTRPNGDGYSFRNSPRRSTFSPTMRSTSLMGTRSCFMLSRSRMVTALSVSVSWSTVMQ
jgi:hypothetical protein